MDGQEPEDQTEEVGDVREENEFEVTLAPDEEDYLEIESEGK